jgi:hypothetical protein
MFFCCEQPADALSDDTLDLDETAQSLSALLHLLHFHPEAPIPTETTLGHESTANSKFNRDHFLPRIPSYDRSTVTPLPVLQPMLFDLVDKYGLSIEVFKVLCLHLLAHAPSHPLRVYGFAASFEPGSLRRRSPAAFSAGKSDEKRDPSDDQFGVSAEKEMEKQMRKTASKASQFLEPIGSYSMEEVLDAIPNVKALHRIVQFQHLRVKNLREVLNESEIFPKGKQLILHFPLFSREMPKSSFVRDTWPYKLCHTHLSPFYIQSRFVPTVWSKCLTRAPFLNRFNNMILSRFAFPRSL